MSFHCIQDRPCACCIVRNSVWTFFVRSGYRLSLRTISCSHLGHIHFQVADLSLDPQDGRITAFPKAGQSIFERVDAYLREQQVVFSELQLEQGRLDEVFRQITTQPVAKEARA